MAEKLPQPDGLQYANLLDQKYDSDYNGFYRQVKFSPDDLCFSLTKNSPKSLYIHNFYDSSCKNFEKSPCITINLGWTIYNHCWYPLLNSSVPESCLILTCSAGHGSHVRLFDAYSSGELISSFPINDQYDEPTASYSVEFSCCGNYIYCGRKNAITVFDVKRNKLEDSFCLGKKPDNISKKLIKTDKTIQKNLLSGIQSTLASHKKSNFILAAGSFSGQICVLDARQNKVLARVDDAHPKGINSLKWRNDHQLLSGARKGDSTIRLWDLRFLKRDKSVADFSVSGTSASATGNGWTNVSTDNNTLEAKNVFLRNVTTHQKYEFDLLDENTIITGLSKSKNTSGSNFKIFKINDSDSANNSFVNSGVPFKIKSFNSAPEPPDLSYSSFTSVAASRFEKGKVLAISGERRQLQFTSSDSDSSDSDSTDSNPSDPDSENFKSTKINSESELNIENEVNSNERKRPRLDPTENKPSKRFSKKNDALVYKIEKNINSCMLVDFAPVF